MENEEQVIIGHFYSIRHRNQGDGTANFLIVPELVMSEAQDGLVSCVGKIKLYAKNMPIQVTGYFKDGIFNVSADCIPTHTRDSTISIIEYVAKNLTERQKNEIAEQCKNDIFAFCQDPDSYNMLCAILRGSVNAEKIAKHIIKNICAMSSMNELETLLLRYGIPFDKIMKMINQGITFANIRKNPYIVFSRHDIPIQTTDIFARTECSVAPYDIIRIKGLVYAALRYLLSAGNTCCTLDQLEMVINVRFRDIQAQSYFGPALLNYCIMDMPNLCRYQQIDGATYVYLNHVWQEESAAIQHIYRLRQVVKSFNTAVGIDVTEAAIGIKYNEGQRAAFKLLRTSGIKILTGPPGSGKTAVINGLIHNFEANQNGTIHLAATTGMAAKVMAAAAGRDAETANKMLRVLPYNDAVRGRDLNDPVDADLIIVDEVSMMGLQMFSVLMQASQNGTIVLLVGDEDQLQSVEYGNVLHELIASGKFEVCRLTEVLRQSGSICHNARQINKGNHELIYDSAFCRKSCSEDSIFAELLQDYNTHESQIICPIKEGAISTASINRFMQAQLNGNSEIAAIYGKRVFRVFDRVIITKTDYEKGYINGDIGYITEKTGVDEFTVQTQDRFLHIEREDLCNVELAYCITVHKCQGTESPKIHVVLPMAASHMMTRRLLYTAITRAKKSVVIYAEGPAFDDAIANKGEILRFTRFYRRLV